jgi:hypothetical protein
MKKTILFVSAAVLFASTQAFAATAAKAVPCTEMSKQVDTAMKGNKLSPADLKTATEHVKAGDDLCKAKKDEAANKEFEAVMKMLKKA